METGTQEASSRWLKTVDTGIPANKPYKQEGPVIPNRKTGGLMEKTLRRDGGSFGSCQALTITKLESPFYRTFAFLPKPKAPCLRDPLTGAYGLLFSPEFITRKNGDKNPSDLVGVKKKITNDNKM